MFKKCSATPLTKAIRRVQKKSSSDLSEELLNILDRYFQAGI
jgi:hypothetical protein